MQVFSHHSKAVPIPAISPASRPLFRITLNEGLWPLARLQSQRMARNLRLEEYDMIK
jgi:hypothetical protein